jgi:hypothetical protein
MTSWHPRRFTSTPIALGLGHRDVYGRTFTSGADNIPKLDSESGLHFESTYVWSSRYIPNLRDPLRFTNQMGSQENPRPSG